MDRIQGFLDSLNTPAEEAIFFSTEKSQQKAIGKFQDMDTSLDKMIKYTEDATALLKPWLQEVLSAESTPQAQLEIMRKYALKMDEIQKNNNLDDKSEFARWNKLFKANGGSRILQRADLKKESVKDVEMKLVAKSLPNGEYNLRVMKVAESLHTFYLKLCSAIEKTDMASLTAQGLQYLTKIYNLIGDVCTKLATRIGYQVIRKGSKKDNYASMAQEAILFSTTNSRQRVINDFDAMDRGINVFVTHIEELIDLLEPAMNDIMRAPDTREDQYKVWQKYDTLFRPIVAKMQGYPGIEQIVAKMRQNGKGNRFFIRADLKKEEVQNAELELVKKCANGEYAQRMSSASERMSVITPKMNDFLQKCADSEWRLPMAHSIVVYIWKWIDQEFAATMFDIKAGVLRLKQPENKRYSFGTLGDK